MIKKQLPCLVMAHGLRTLAKLDSEFATKSAKILAHGSRYMHPTGGATLAVAQRRKYKMTICFLFGSLGSDQEAISEVIASTMLDFTRRPLRGVER